MADEKEEDQKPESEEDLIPYDQQKQSVYEMIDRVKAETFGMQINEKYLRRIVIKDASFMKALGGAQGTIKYNLGLIDFLKELVKEKYSR